jgi:hypothetical protein
METPPGLNENQTEPAPWMKARGKLSFYGAEANYSGFMLRGLAANGEALSFQP